jgi:DNA-binding NarL/FixJ family response regulator
MGLRVLIADDHGIVREGLRSLIAEQRDMSVVGEAEDGRAAVELARELSPDVVIMDVSMPGLNGIEATRQIGRAAPAPKVIALSMHNDKRFVAEMLAAGASGYLLKDCAFDELVRAIRAVVSGQTYLSPGVAGAVVQDYLGGERPTEEDVYDRLSEREKQVLKLIADGSTNKEIASLLDIAVKTVMAHRTNLMTKIGAHSRTDIFKFALRKGLIVVEPDDE